MEGGYGPGHPSRKIVSQHTTLSTLGQSLYIKLYSLNDMRRVNVVATSKRFGVHNEFPASLSPPAFNLGLFHGFTSSTCADSDLDILLR